MSGNNHNITDAVVGFCVLVGGSAFGGFVGGVAAVTLMRLVQ